MALEHIAICVRHSSFSVKYFIFCLSLEYRSILELYFANSQYFSFILIPVALVLHFLSVVNLCFDIVVNPSSSFWQFLQKSFELLFSEQLLSFLCGILQIYLSYNLSQLTSYLLCTLDRFLINLSFRYTNLSKFR